MAVVYIGLTGEGRGHAMRACTIIDHLRRQHRVVVLTHGQAYDLLAPRYRRTRVRVRRIPGFRNRYDRQHRLAYAATACHAVPALARMPETLRRLSDELVAVEAALVVSDFEPLTIHAAHRAGVPVFSIDHQGCMLYCDFPQLSLRQRVDLAWHRTVIGRLWGKPDRVVISGFHLPELERPDQRISRVGVLLRDEVLEATPTLGDHLTAYVRAGCSTAFLETLHATGREVRIYGIGSLPDHGRLRFRGVSTSGFLRDLASSVALVTTAGNQLVGEALYLGKPVLGLPEPRNFEQELNGHLLELSGCGISVGFPELTPRTVLAFLERRDDYVQRIDRNWLRGNERVFELLDQQLGQPDSARTGTVELAA